jgi:hypothetical protein
MFSNLMLRAVHNANMSDRPGYYSGRGANASDLNSKMLESIYKSIEDGVSKEAAEAFVQMVEDIPVLSATDFLITLSRFEGNKFVWDKSLLSQQKGVYISDASSSVGLGEAFGTVMSAMGGPQKDSTASIRRDFLWNHGRRTPPTVCDRFHDFNYRGR